MLAGVLIEALADRQKTQFQQRGDDKPDVLDTGLRGWCRHPDCFGDSLAWNGAWLTAAASSPGAWSVPAPATMSCLLIFATGAYDVAEADVTVEVVTSSRRPYVNDGALQIP